jgi:hypothetical protein
MSSPGNRTQEFENLRGISQEAISANNMMSVGDMHNAMFNPTSDDNSAFMVGSVENLDFNSFQKKKIEQLRKLKQKQALMQPSSYDGITSHHASHNAPSAVSMAGKSDAGHYTYQNVSQGEPFMHPDNNVQDLTSVSQMQSRNM